MSHNDAYTVEIIETYHGDEISAELFESKAREPGIIAAPEFPFGVRVFDADAGETVPEGIRRFQTLVAARAYFEGIDRDHVGVRL